MTTPFVFQSRNRDGTMIAKAARLKRFVLAGLFATTGVERTSVRHRSSLKLCGSSTECFAQKTENVSLHVVRTLVHAEKVDIVRLPKRNMLAVLR